MGTDNPAYDLPCVLANPRSAGAWCNSIRAGGHRIGFVPTMGALHEGHLSLIIRARADNDFCCVSIFVNPLQFNDQSDLENYPQDMDTDIQKLRDCGCHMVFKSTLGEFFPDIHDLQCIPLLDPGPAAMGLEGEYRPGHLAGVATIVERLFATVGNCRAYFGEKDFQQTLVIKHLASKLSDQGVVIDVVVCPTIRNAAGLALSSRNQRLSPDQQSRAVYLYRSLCAAREAWRRGERNPAQLSMIMHSLLNRAEFQVDYAEVQDPQNWNAAGDQQVLQRGRALIAAYLDDVRLIDNMSLDDSSL